MLKSFKNQQHSLGMRYILSWSSMESWTDCLSISISLHSIYRFIRQEKSKGGTLFHNLRFRNQRKRKYVSIETRDRQSICKRIHHRPIEVELRARFGDLEIDTIVGKNHRQSLVSIVDWKTGYLWLKKYGSQTTEEINQATISLLEPIKGQLKTITTDNGKESSLQLKQYTGISLSLTVLGSMG